MAWNNNIIKYLIFGGNHEPRRQALLLALMLITSSLAGCLGTGDDTRGLEPSWSPPTTFSNSLKPLALTLWTCNSQPVQHPRARLRAHPGRRGDARRADLFLYTASASNVG